MKQIIQNQKTGELKLEDTPLPSILSNGILVQNAFSLISAGTEKASISTAQANIINKARQRPDLVKQVIDNVKREGLWATYEKVKSRLDDIKPLGYSSAGFVIETKCDEFRIGDRVACAGVGYASHAEYIYVPKNLAVKIPDNVELDESAFTTVGAIAMQGVRQANARIGETVVVIGLGLIGLITLQILKAGGCNVIGIDINDKNFEIAKKLGCDEVFISDPECIKLVENYTSGIGADAILITAATTSNEPIESAILMARKKGTIVIVGNVGMNLPRSPFYEKELNILISCSYGPGRYDPIYEEKGIDYPVGYVRWTENRNMQAFLNLISTKKVNVKDLITHKFPFDDAISAYDLILNNKEKYIGVLLEYPQQSIEYENLKNESKVLLTEVKPVPSGNLTLGFIGAGKFAQSYLLPNIKKSKEAVIKGVCTSHNTSAKKVAQKFGFEYCTTNPQDILNDKSINAVFIATHHKSHAKFVIDTLRSGKHVFVEKPLCVNTQELTEIKSAYESSNSILSVGFNRRFSPYSKKIKNFFSSRLEPFIINYRVNAGKISKDHWLRDPEQGGRIIGEVCHFIDFAQFLADSLPIRIYAECIEKDDSCIIMIRFKDNSIANILYISNADPNLPKERIEISCSEKTAVLENWQKLTFYEKGNKKNIHIGMGQKKGHKEEIDAFFNAIQKGTGNTIPFESIYMTTLSTFKIHESLESGQVINLD